MPQRLLAAQRLGGNTAEREGLRSRRIGVVAQWVAALVQVQRVMDSTLTEKPSATRLIAVRW